MRQVAKIWLAIGIGGLLFRTVHLFFIRDVETGLVWMTKILTDPFSDLKLYYKAPLYLMRGELIDPGLDIIEHTPEADGTREADGRNGRLAVHRGRRRVIISFRICRRMALLVSEASRHHQPSRFIFSAAVDETIGDFGKIRVGVVQAEDQPAGADPAQRELLRPADSIEASSCSATARYIAPSRSTTGWRPGPAAPARPASR